MFTQNPIIWLLVLLAIAFFAFHLLKKPKKTAPPPTHGSAPKDGTKPKPNPGKPKNPPAPPGTTPPANPVPEPPPESPEVIIDRNGKRPGDVGYDPRIDRPKDDFSPPPPFGAYYHEDAFDPDGPWFGPDGYHWTDKRGIHHGP